MSEIMQLRVLDEAFARTSKPSDYPMTIRFQSLIFIHKWGANKKSSELEE